MRLCVIHTGGTIGSTMTPTGFAPKPGLVEETLTRLVEAGEVQVAYDMVLADPLIDSSQAQVADWNWIAGEIAARHDSHDGFVVIHGTDSMCYAAAALALALEGLAKPVVVTGSMVPLSVAGNDGARNLVEAMAAACSAAPGVWVQFAGQLLPGTRVQKVHSVARDAFDADRRDVVPAVVADVFRQQIFASQSIAVITLTPGIQAAMLRDMCARADGVILRCFGSGNVPGDAAFRAFLQDLAARDLPVLAISQCAAGGMVMGTYSAGAALAEARAIDGKDMTLEAAYAKLMLGLTRYEGAALRQYLETPQCGGITN
ncbi:asparaginase [Epibacterium ulvae]|uniref:asparaginase domain-containing protein n=1 Tax=Epibacterium ulvae TaxID=1156985 RepID=UPI001BFC7EA4|nr:asparaginase domain-containing protein [Epibacterium ulvae]MBT8155633.1 asparaginase [Epibacterium ulvae]